MSGGIIYTYRQDGVAHVFVPSTPENDAIIKKTEEDLCRDCRNSNSDTKAAICLVCSLVIGTVLSIVCRGCFNGGSDDMSERVCSISCPPAQRFFAIALTIIGGIGTLIAICIACTKK